MWRWLQGGAGKASAEKTHNKRPTDGHYPELGNDQLYNPYTEVLVLTGGCVSSVHQISLVDENKFVTASDNGSAIVWDAETGQKLLVLDHRSGERERVSLVCVLPLQPVNDSMELHSIMTADSVGRLHVWSWTVHDPLRETPDQKIITDHDGRIKTCMVHTPFCPYTNLAHGGVLCDVFQVMLWFGVRLADKLLNYCLVQFNPDLICSGGSDLCLWNRRGKLLSKYSRKGLEEKSSIHSVLKLDSRHFGVVAASDYKSLAVYDINKYTMRETDDYDLKFVRYLLSSHVQNICCLTSISANLFASGSCDGVVLLWSTSSLSAMKMFQCADGIPKELTASLGQPTPAPMTASPTQIKHILVIGERYLFAAVNCGFKVYDVLTYEDTQGHPKPLASVLVAHQQPITCMAFLIERAMLVTASEDHTVRLWGRPNKLKRESDGNITDSQLSGRFLIEEFLGIELNVQRSRKTRGNLTLPMAPMLLGELLLHSSAVKVVLEIENHGLVTCSTDNFIILWKDAEKERERRDFNMRAVLHGDILEAATSTL